MHHCSSSYGRRHQMTTEAPFCAEREAYLLHLQKMGASYRELKLVAGYLLHIVRILDMTSLRPVSEEEIRAAGNHWARYTGPNKRALSCRGSPRYLVRFATQWFNFLGLMPTPPRPRFHELIVDFDQAMINVRRLSPMTVKAYRERVSVFLNWLRVVNGRTLSAVSLPVIDDFLTDRRATCCNATLASYCQALRTFFGWAEENGLCFPGLPLGIKSPSVPKYRVGNAAPSWADVKRVLRSTGVDGPLELRARGILLLFSIYGLRNSEVGGLLLSDFDWQNETFVVRRAKRGGVQQFPIQFELGEAIIRYLREGRPRTNSRFLFVKSRRPFASIGSGAMWQIVAERMKAAHVNTLHLGPHALRHGCATRLLRKGVSMQDIADFLGHRDYRSVGIYARHDKRLLRRVADFSFGSLQ
jgi:integrase/recombinase XerD